MLYAELISSDAEHSVPPPRRGQPAVYSIQSAGEGVIPPPHPLPAQHKILAMPVNEEYWKMIHDTVRYTIHVESGSAPNSNLFILWPRSVPPEHFIKNMFLNL